MGILDFLKRQGKRMVVDDHGIVYFVSADDSKATEELAAKGLIDVPSKGMSDKDWKALQSLRR